jgi:hypothetical protein
MQKAMLKTGLLARGYIGIVQLNYMLCFFKNRTTPGFTIWPPDNQRNNGFLALFLGMRQYCFTYHLNGLLCRTKLH